MDKIETIDGALIQHGKHNNRIYVMKFDAEQSEPVIYFLNKLAIEKSYSKVFAKIPPIALPAFQQSEFSIEAVIPGFYVGVTDCFFVSRFYNENRKISNSVELANFSDFLQKEQATKVPRFKHSLKYSIIKLQEKHVAAICNVFSQVFETYPFPVNDPKFVLKTMKSENTKYFGVLDGNQLVAVSSSEIDFINKNAEMTDFAVLPKYRGQELAMRLLLMMENEMKIANIKTVYTIARLKEIGINKTFLKCGYHFSGTLINNTNISGNIESMNIYYKHL